MGTLTALVLATPIFGFALTPPALPAMLPSSLAPLQGEHVAAAEAPQATSSGALAQLDSALSVAALGSGPLANLGASMPLAQLDSDDPEEVGEELQREQARTAAPSLQVKDDDAGPQLDKETYRLQLKKRARFTKIHRTLGITTWALMGIAVISGTIQWHNLYGHGGIGSNPCVKGDALISQNQCSGQPWFHELTSFAAGAAYFSTLGVAMAMPDPDHASVGNSAYAKNLRTHKILRWVHLSGMVAQMVLGIIIANPKLSGLDRANDYNTLKALSVVHLATGYATFGALSWAGTIMLK